MKQELLNLLKQLRINKNLKQDDVAAHLGIGNGTISNYETGKTEPDIDTFMKMCKFYGVDGTSILQEAYSVTSNSFDLSNKEKEYIKKYRSLNENGKIKLNGYLDDLIDNSKYIRFEPDFSQVVRTAESFSNAMQNQRTPIDNNTNK